MTEEIWKQSPDYPRYEVSSLGRVRDLRNGRFPTFRRHRYLTVRINSEPKPKVEWMTVARLILKTFHPTKKEKAIVRYIDGDPTNVNLNNLEWTTVSEMARLMYKEGRMRPNSMPGETNPNAKLTWEKAERIKSLKGKMTATQAGRQENISRPTVTLIWSGKRWNKKAEVKKKVCDTCVKDLHKQGVFTWKVAPPKNFGKEFDRQINEAYERAKSGLDNYAAQLGNAALEHNREAFNFSNYGSGSGRSRQNEF